MSNRLPTKILAEKVQFKFSQSDGMCSLMERKLFYDLTAMRKTVSLASIGKAKWLSSFYFTRLPLSSACCLVLREIVYHFIPWKRHVWIGSATLWQRILVCQMSPESHRRRCVRRLWDRSRWSITSMGLASIVKATCLSGYSFTSSVGKQCVIVWSTIIASLQSCQAHIPARCNCSI